MLFEVVDFLQICTEQKLTCKLIFYKHLLCCHANIYMDRFEKKTLKYHLIEYIGMEFKYDLFFI